MFALINVAAFQVGWFSSVLGGANNLPWVGPLVVLAVVAFHIRSAKRPSSELLLILCCAVIGGIFDSILVANNWVSYFSGFVGANLAPYWIITMWALFATTLNVSLRWLRKMPLVAVAFGAVGGPLTYLAGQKLGGIVLVDSFAALVALAIGWGVMMPLLMKLAESLDGMTTSSRSSALETTS